MSEGEREKSIDVDEEKLEQLVIERMGHISSELAHDLRSPLQTIQNAIYLLQRSPDNEQLYAMVRQSLVQATEILDSFRDYYKAHNLQLIDVDPSKIVDLAFSELEIPENINVDREVESAQPLSLDPSKLAMAIRKLLLNAIEAMPEGGELVVRILDVPEAVKITVKDTGAGISPDVVEVLYTPFLAQHKKGRGLGLPAAKRVVESHGGELSYESEEGVGTVFTITLPRSAVNL